MMRTFRPLAALLALSFLALATLAPVASAIPPPPLDEVCVDVRPGVIACGWAEVAFPSVGAGAGAATGVVAWKLTVYSQSGVGSSPTVTAPAATLAAVGASSTRDCAYAVLTADSVIVARSQTLCWDI